MLFSSYLASSMVSLLHHSLGLLSSLISYYLSQFVVAAAYQEKQIVSPL